MMGERSWIDRFNEDDEPDPDDQDEEGQVENQDEELFQMEEQVEAEIEVILEAENADTLHPFVEAMIAENHTDITWNPDDYEGAEECGPGYQGYCVVHEEDLEICRTFFSGDPDAEGFQVPRNVVINDPYIAAVYGIF